MEHSQSRAHLISSTPGESVLGLSAPGGTLIGVEEGAAWSQFVAACLALVGTSLQVRSSLEQKKVAAPSELHTFATVDGWKGEVSRLRHPVHWWHHRRTLRDILKKPSEEVRVYRRVRRELWGWAALWAASFLAVLATGVALLSGWKWFEV